MSVPVPCAIVLVPISACIVAGEPTFVSTHLLGCSLGLLSCEDKDQRE
jgi:hypothetical protein